MKISVNVGEVQVEYESPPKAEGGDPTTTTETEERFGGAHESSDQESNPYVPAEDRELGEDEQPKTHEDGSIVRPEYEGAERNKQKEDKAMETRRKKNENRTKKSTKRKT